MKSKTQKQQEAIERKRSKYNSESLAWRRSRAYPEGDMYQYWRVNFGIAFADKCSARVDQEFKHYLKEAQLDSHGNPLEYLIER